MVMVQERNFTWPLISPGAIYINDDRKWDFEEKNFAPKTASRSHLFCL